MKKSQKYLLLLSFLTLLAGAGFWLGGNRYNTVNDVVIPDEFIFQGQKIALAWTDDNAGENLIIKSDKKNYYGRDNTEVYFSITNASGEDQEMDVVVWVGSEKVKVEEIGKINSDNNFQFPISNFQSISNDQFSNRKDIKSFTNGHFINDEIKLGETNFYKAKIKYPPMSEGEFFIEAFGGSVAYGHLDPWYSSGWTYRKRVTIDHTKVSSDLTNFPALVSITDSDLSSHARSDGFDIMFVSIDDSTKFDYEREKYVTGELVAWVEIPFVSSTAETAFFMYYGNSGASDQQDMEGTWDSDFKMVQHLQETPPGTTVDSTINSNDGTTSGMDSANQVAGQINGSLDFDEAAETEYINMGSGTNLEIAGAFSVSAWLYPTSEITDDGLTAISTFNSNDADDDTGWNFAPIWDYGDENFEFRIQGPSAGIARAITSDNFFDTENLNQWRYVVGVYSPTNYLYVYVDGVLAGSDTSNIPASVTYGGDDFTIGRISNTVSHSFWDGGIDEVRVSNGTRTIGWIETEYNNQDSPSTFMSFDQEETFSTMGVKVNTSLLGKWTSGLVGYWSFNGEDMDWSAASAEAIDRSGEGNDGDVVGASAVVGKVGQALDFNGTSDYIQTVSNELKTANNFTLSVWFKTDSVTNSGHILWQGAVAGDGWGSNEEFNLNTGAFNESDVINFFIGQDWSGETNTMEIRAAFTDTADWHHLVVIAEDLGSSPSSELFIDGVSGGTDTMPVALTRTTWDTDLRIGRPGTSTRFYDGIIDEVRVYNRILSDDEISEQYRAGARRLGINTPITDRLTSGLVGSWSFNGEDMDWSQAAAEARDTSGEANHGDVSGASAVVGKVGQGLDFDGGSDYVDIGIGPTSVKSIGFWVYPETTTEYFINLTSNTDYIWANAGTVTATGLTSPSIYVDGAVSSAIAADKWQYVVITSDTAENASNLDIGRTTDTNYLEGKFDEVRLYSDVLSADEIGELYRMGARKIGL